MGELPGVPAAPREARTMRIELSLRSAFSILGIIIGLWLLVQFWQIVLLLIIAAVLAGTLNPVVDWLEAHRVKRAVALTLILLALVIGIVGLAVLVVPALISQVTSFVEGAPAFQQRLADGLEQYPLLAERAAAIREFRPEQLLDSASSGALPLAGLIAESATLGLTTVVLTFYLLADRERTVGFLYALLPRRYHVRTARILLDMERIVGGYVRGRRRHRHRAGREGQRGSSVDAVGRRGRRMRDRHWRGAANEMR